MKTHPEAAAANTRFATPQTEGFFGFFFYAYFYAPPGEGLALAA